jgi:hypothetical protein
LTGIPFEHYPPGLEPGAATPEALRSLALGLRARAPDLRRLPSAEILRALDRLHAEWASSGSALRPEAVRALEGVTGYAPAAIDAALLGLFRRMDRPEMERWLAAGGVTAEALDGSSEELLVFGPELTVVVSSGNIPGAALPSVAQALLLESPCLAKTGSAEPALLPLYARSLAAAAPELAAGLAVTTWEGGREDLERALLAEADALVVYGGNEAVRSLRAHLPAHARFIGYGHRISFAAVGRELLTPEQACEAARLAAVDVATFDQQGCLSPQALYVERGGAVSPEQFAELLAGALARLAVELPRRSLSPAEAAAIHQLRSAYEVRSALEPGVRLYTNPDRLEWTVAVDPDPTLAPCPLNRTAIIRPIERLEELPRHLAALRGALLSAGLGVGFERRRALARDLAAAGVTRITTLGEAQRPETELFHDGVNAIAALARYVHL